MQKTINIVTLLENNPITCPVYGTIPTIINDAPEVQSQKALRCYNNVQAQKAKLAKKRAENTKHK